jgi:hypothetical protein
VLLDDLLGHPGITPLEDEADPGFEQVGHRGSDAVAGIETDHEFWAALLEDQQCGAKEIGEPSRTDHIARIQVVGDGLRLVALSTGHGRWELVAAGARRRGK